MGTCGADNGADNGADRLIRINEIFSKALDLDVTEREAFIASACGGDVSLHGAVSRLITASQEPCHFLESGGAHKGPLWDELSAELINACPVPIGGQIGAYRIIRELGHGGMASVFLGERADGQYRQQVAIKILRQGDDSEELILRFQQERQILASLDHPAIARLIDGGVTADGRPVIVMEKVDGEPIDAYCDRHCLTVEERLQLFLEVVRAVHYAHQNLVVHRDLKPSNIMVTDDGRVKLLDFGIAKLLDREAYQPATPETRTGIRVLTPEYASPEQVRGGPVTTASDVYQLGLLLYELLCGCRAYRLQGRTPSEIEQVICEQEPVPPSAATAVGSDGNDVKTGEQGTDKLSEARRTRPERLRRRLTGDLDTIVLMALRKEPQRRYGSVELLGQDIERHLTGLPVSARRSTFSYRLFKLLKRHKLAVASAAAILVLVAVVMIFYTSRLATERDRARLEAEKANEVSAYLEGLFQTTDSFRSRGKEISTAEMLEQEVRRIDTELKDQPHVQIEMRTLIGNIYQRLGMIDDAGEQFEQILKISERLAGPEQASYASILTNLARIYFEQSRFPEAEELYRQALAIYQKVVDPDDLRLAQSRYGLATLFQRVARYPEAEQLMHLVVAAREQNLGPDHPDTIDSRAGLLYAQQRFLDAEPLYRRSLEIRKRTLGPEHIDIGFNLRQIAWAAGSRGSWDEAEQLHRQALEILERNLGPEHYELGHSLRDLAVRAGFRGRVREAGALCERTLSIQEKLLAPNNPILAGTLANLAFFKAAAGEMAAADELFLRTISICEESLGGDHPLVVFVLNNLAFFSWVRGFERETEEYCLRAIEIEKTRGGDTVAATPTLDTLACLYIDQGKMSQAESLLQRSKAVLERAQLTDQFNYAAVLRNLARISTRLGRDDDGAAHFERSLSIIRKLLQGDPESLWYRKLLASTLMYQGVMFQQQGNSEKARGSWMEADTVTALFTCDSEILEAVSIRASLLLRLGRVSEARPLVRRALESGWRPKDLIELCDQHGLLTEGMATSAEVLIEQRPETRRPHLGGSAPHPPRGR